MSTSSASPAAVEAANPGMRAVAGPFGVCNTSAAVKKAERAACVRAHRDQVSHGVKAKIVMDGRMAWVLRDSKGWRYDDTEKAKNLATLAKIKNGRMATR